MEFHGYFLDFMEPFVSSKLWVLNLDGIPWSFEFSNFDDSYIQICRMD